MSKLIVLQGPPCSGKSTWAKNYIKGRENECIIVSRDAIRLAMCGGDVTTMFQGMKQDREDIVTQTETILIEQGLSKGYEVIVVDNKHNQVRHYIDIDFAQLVVTNRELAKVLNTAQVD